MSESKITPELLASLGLSMAPPDDPIYSSGPLVIFDSLAPKGPDEEPMEEIEADKPLSEESIRLGLRRRPRQERPNSWTNGITPEFLAKLGLSLAPPDDPVYDSGSLVIFGPLSAPKVAEEPVEEIEADKPLSEEEIQ
jgi:hypothetical protein